MFSVLHKIYILIDCKRSLQLCLNKRLNNQQQKRVQEPSFLNNRGNSSACDRESLDGTRAWHLHLAQGERVSS